MALTHYISMIVISVGSFIFGILPLTFTIRITKHCPFFLSLVLCLGGGVLLATSIVHMLTEVQEKLHSSAQLYFSLGFLILYTFDEICHFCLGGKQPEVHLQKSDLASLRRGSYGTIKNLAHTERSLLLDSNNPVLREQESNITKPCCSKPCPANAIQNEHRNQNVVSKSNGSCSYYSSHPSDDQTQCHIELREPCSSNPVAKTGLLLALVIHSVLEGISIGVQTAFNEIVLLLAIITFHKTVLSFCLGLELHSHGVKSIYVILAVLVFSGGTAIGILIGTLVTSTNGIFNIDGQMQAIAAGSLLYVAAFEVLPRERFIWQHNYKKQTAGLFQLLAVTLGFICITLLHMFVVHRNGHSEDHSGGGS